MSGGDLASLSCEGAREACFRPFSRPFFAGLTNLLLPPPPFQLS